MIAHLAIVRRLRRELRQQARDADSRRVRTPRDLVAMCDEVLGERVCELDRQVWVNKVFGVYDCVSIEDDARRAMTHVARLMVLVLVADGISSNS